MIYLDHNATTPVAPEVFDAMLPLLETEYANASSKHAAGEAVRAKVERARRQVAELAGTAHRNIVFTSGATEAAALAMHRLVERTGRTTILVAASEHHCVLEAAANSGATVKLIRVRTDGVLDVDSLDAALDEDVAMVAVMAANNETGVLNDIADIAGRAHGVGALMFTDVTQQLGKLPVALDAWGVDFAVASAHKLYGPKGIGMLSAAPGPRSQLEPLFAGGHQERGIRGGTVNSVGVVGFGRAAEIASTSMDTDRVHSLKMRDTFYFELRSRTSFAWYGRHAPLIPNTLCLRFAGAPAEAVLDCLPTDLAISSGSACSSADTEPSHVLTAMGVEPEAALEALRISVGRYTTLDEVRTAAHMVADAVDRVRSLSARNTPRKVS